MSIAITSIEASASQAAQATQPNQNNIQASTRGNSQEVVFQTNQSGTAPLDRIGDATVNALRGFEDRLQDYNSGLNRMHGQGTQNDALAAARESYMPGPASLHLAQPATIGPAGGTPPHDVQDAVEAMRLSFDYAVETQLVVKTGSQFSNSANSLLRGQ